MGDASLSESTVEAVALEQLSGLGWAIAHSPDIAPDTPTVERADYAEVVLNNRLRTSLAQLDPTVTDDVIEDVLHQLTLPVGPTLEARNRDIHRKLVDGVTVEYVDSNGRVRGDHVKVFDFDDPDANDWLAVS